MRALVVLLVLAGTAAAETNMVDSVEWATADSDVVVRGTIASVTSRPSGNWVWYDATITVTETIKGPKHDTIRVGLGPFVDDAPEKLRDRKADLLLFLVAGKRLVGYDKTFARIALGLRVGRGKSIVELGTTHLYTGAFDSLERVDDQLAAARAAAKSPATKSFRVEVPVDAPAYRELYGGSIVWIYLPIDPAAESRAVGWIADKEMWTREQGVSALANFRSDANIARLEKLLNDPGYMIHVGRKQYLVRAKAHEVLDGWHVRHATPVLDEPAP
jgi:hypothetical protein